MPKRVLVIDQVPVHRIRLAAMVEGAQYSVTCVSDAAEIAPCSSDVDIVVLGLSSGQAPSDVQTAVRGFSTSGIPVLCLDSDPSPLRRLLAMKSGARDVLPRLSPDGLVLARIRGLLREYETCREFERRRMTAASFGFAERSQDFAHAARIGCVGISDDVARMLSAAEAHRFETRDVESAIRDAAADNPPDVYLLQVTDDGRALDDLLPELRDRNHSRRAPTLVIYDAGQPQVAQRALALGATDIAADTSSGEELELRINELLRLKRLGEMLRRSDELSHQLAATDHLTGLYNRRYAETYLGDLMMRSSEVGSSFVLMVVDLDHFKTVNDTHGHTAGDEVLCEVAHRLRDNLRACDLVSRHGGEEFLIVLPDTGLDEALLTADRLRRALSEAPVKVTTGTEIPVTASIGVAPGRVEAALSGRKNGTYDAQDFNSIHSLADIFGAADAALYRAKETGRNRVEFNVV